MMTASLYEKKGEAQRAKELFENIAITDKEYYYNTIRMIDDTNVLTSKPITELEKIRDASLGTKRMRSEGTRLNSSHVRISYAVFCLKKKKKNRADAT